MTPLPARLFILLFILFSPVSTLLFSQKKAGLTAEDNPVKWLNSDLGDIAATIIHVEDTLLYYDIDTRTNMLYAVSAHDTDKKSTRKGLLSAYDLSANKTMWIREFISSRDVFMLIDTVPMLIGEGSHAFDPRTGQPIWSSQLQLLPLWNKEGIIFGSDQKGDSLYGLNLHNGSILWKKLSRPWLGTETILPVGDTGIAIIRNSFRYIGLKSGEGFQVYDQDRIYYNPFFHAKLGFMRALFAERGSLTPGKTHEVFNENSSTNAVFREGEIYLATDKEIIAFTPKGEIRWEYKLPRKIVGLCRLFIYNNHLYAVNYGYIETVSYALDGNLFIGCFEPETGNMKFASNLNGDKRTNINQMTVKDSMMILITNRGTIELTLNGLQVVKISETVQNSGMGIADILEPPHFILKDDHLENRSLTRPERIVVKNHNDVKIEMTESFQPISVIPKDAYFSLLGNLGDRMVLSNGSEIVLANDNLALYHIRFSKNAQRKGDIISDHNETSILLLPANQVIGE